MPAMYTLQSILVVGATGAFGKSVCLAIAQERSRFKRIAIFHDTSRPTSESKAATISDLKEAGFEVVQSAGYDDVEAFRGFDCVISLLGNHALHQQPAIFGKAIDAGVRHFYPSEYGADLTVGQNWTQRYYRYKVITREFLEEKGREIPELGWTYFTLGRLAEWSVLFHFGFDNRNAKAKIYGTESGRQSLLSTPNAAAYITETLTDPMPEVGENEGETKGRRRTYRISGQSPTWKEIFDALDTITGRKYEVTYLDVETAQHEEADALRDGDVDKELAASHKLIQGREGTLIPEPWDNGRFPNVKVDNFRDVLAAAFKDPFYQKAYFATGNTFEQ
jgi:hypothetical protein